MTYFGIMVIIENSTTDTFSANISLDFYLKIGYIVNWCKCYTHIVRRLYTLIYNQVFTYIVCGFVGDTITVDKYVDNIKSFL